jgi:hypothetical protein
MFILEPYLAVSVALESTLVALIMEIQEEEEDEEVMNDSLPWCH